MDKWEKQTYVKFSKIIWGIYVESDTQRSQWKRIEERRKKLYGYYVDSNFGKYEMEKYNSYINKTVQPFLDQLHAPLTMTQITEEERLASIESDRVFWRDAIKKARNKWVDDHPHEAERRGISRL